MNAKYIIRTIEFGTPDFDQAIQLRTEELRIPLNLEFTTDEISQEWEQFHIGAFDAENRLVGILVFKKVNDSTLKMRQVAISSDYQSQGIGKLLVSYAEKWALGHAFNLIELHARNNAVPFYEKQKYQKVGEQFMEVNIPHFKMQKKIKEAVS